MPSITTQAIVMRYTNYKEHDRILTLFSPEYGQIDVLSRGCRKPKNKLLPASELFVTGEFVLNLSKEHYYLTSALIEDTFYPLRLDAYKLTCASYIVSLTNYTLLPCKSASKLYALLLTALYKLSYDNKKSLELTNEFLLLFICIVGYRPQLSTCLKCNAEITTNYFFNVNLGGIICDSCHALADIPLTKKEYDWLRSVLVNGFDNENIVDNTLIFKLLRTYIETKLDVIIKAGKFLP